MKLPTTSASTMAMHVGASLCRDVLKWSSLPALRKDRGGPAKAPADHGHALAPHRRWCARAGPRRELGPLRSARLRAFDGSRRHTSHDAEGADASRAWTAGDV